MSKLNLSVKSTLAMILIAFVVSCISIWISNGFGEPEESEEQVLINDYREELEIDYWLAKSELIDEVKNYIDSVSNSESDLSAIVLVNACDEYGIDIRLPLAQGHLESHFGTKGLATRTNSVWNVGAFDGKSNKEIKSDYHYSHPDRSVKPYLELLKNKYLIGKTETDLLVDFTDQNKKRYATYKNYEKELQMKVDSMKSIGVALGKYRKAKLRLNR